MHISVFIIAFNEIPRHYNTINTSHKNKWNS